MLLGLPWKATLAALALITVSTANKDQCNVGKLIDGNVVANNLCPRNQLYNMAEVEKNMAMKIPYSLYRYNLYDITAKREDPLLPQNTFGQNFELACEQTAMDKAFALSEGDPNSIYMVFKDYTTPGRNKESFFSQGMMLLTCGILRSPLRCLTEACPFDKEHYQYTRHDFTELSLQDWRRTLGGYLELIQDGLTSPIEAVTLAKKTKLINCKPNTKKGCPPPTK